MSLAESLKTPQRRINPHRGLVIDVPRWMEAHEYHQMQQARHGLVMHCSGIVSGLEVTASDPPAGWVVVHPGAALDQEGRLIVVPESHRLELPFNAAGVAYIALQYREVPDVPTLRSADGRDQSLYTLEVYSISGSRQAPDGQHLELARVQISGAGAIILNPTDPRTPGPDEIDQRYRQSSGPWPSKTINIGSVSLDASSGEAAPHLLGVLDLIQCINCTTKFRAQFAGVLDLTEDVERCDLLLLAGSQYVSLSSTSGEALKAFLARGGIFFGEFCGASGDEGQDAAAFRDSILDLATEMDTALKPVERGHPLLTACHQFAGPPPGIGRSAQILVGEGMIYSEGDFGCLWSGGRPESTMSREAIRSATEFGVNLGVYSASNTHSHSLSVASA